MREIVPSTRNKTLWSLGEQGDLHWDHMTSERNLLSTGRATRRSACSAILRKATRSWPWTTAGDLTAWRCEAAHPETSWRTLLRTRALRRLRRSRRSRGRRPAATSSSRSTASCRCCSARSRGRSTRCCLRCPWRLCGAMYTAHFTTPAFKKTIKPIVEIMAAIPSVVIGFLVALWLAPILERWIIAVFLSLVTIPAVFLAFMVCWQFVRRFDRGQASRERLRVPGVGARDPGGHWRWPRCWPGPWSRRSSAAVSASGCTRIVGHAV